MLLNSGNLHYLRVMWCSAPFGDIHTVGLCLSRIRAQPGNEIKQFMILPAESQALKSALASETFLMLDSSILFAISTK